MCINRIVERLVSRVENNLEWYEVYGRLKAIHVLKYISGTSG